MSCSRRAPPMASLGLWDRARGSLEAYVATNLWWHIRGAMGDTPPARALIEHADHAILESVALAMGEERISAIASAWEAEGDKLGAAKLYWVGTMLTGRGVQRGRGDDFVFRAADLLAAVGSDETAEFEMDGAQPAFGAG